MFSAFRRNEKGLVDLNIGSSPNKFGNQKLAREWYDKFLRGEEDYLTDEKWYDSAKDAQEKKTGIPSGNPIPVGEDSGPPGGGGGIFRLQSLEVMKPPHQFRQKKQEVK